MCDACGGQKTVLNLLELVTGVTTTWMLGTELWSSVRAAGSLNQPLDHPSSPVHLFKQECFSSNHGGS